MLVSGICQKILVERLDKFPEPLTGEGYLSAFPPLPGYLLKYIPVL